MLLCGLLGAAPQHCRCPRSHARHPDGVVITRKSKQSAPLSDPRSGEVMRELSGGTMTPSVAGANYASSREGAVRVVAEITAKGGNAIAVQGDVSKAEDVKRMFAQTKEAFGKIDILMNNAGVYTFEPVES